MQTTTFAKYKARLDPIAIVTENTICDFIKEEMSKILIFCVI